MIIVQLVNLNRRSLVTFRPDLRHSIVTPWVLDPNVDTTVGVLAASISAIIDAAILRTLQMESVEQPRLLLNQQN